MPYILYTLEADTAKYLLTVTVNLFGRRVSRSAISYWPLAIGCWLLAVGCWPLFFAVSYLYFKTYSYICSNFFNY